LSSSFKSRHCALRTYQWQNWVVSLWQVKAQVKEFNRTDKSGNFRAVSFYIGHKTWRHAQISFHKTSAFDTPGHT